MRILFSILKYELITEESMNIGVLFHNLSTDERVMTTINKWKRLEHFDDEVNVNMLKIIVNGINDEIKNNKSKFDIYEYPLKYVNELRFTEVCQAEVEDFETFIELTRQSYLRYDYDKSQRPDRENQVKIMKQLMKSSAVKYSTKKIYGTYKEGIKYDYTIGNYGFKIFTFENNKKIANLVSIAKSWAYTAIEMKGKIETVFLYDSDVEDNSFDVIMKLLKSTGCKVIKVDEGMDYIIKLFNEINKSQLES